MLLTVMVTWVQRVAIVISPLPYSLYANRAVYQREVAPNAYYAAGGGIIPAFGVLCRALRHNTLNSNSFLAGPHFAGLKTLPFFMTKLTCLSVEMFSSGFSGVAMMSAYWPAVIAPRAFSTPSRRAALVVMVCKITLAGMSASIKLSICDIVHVPRVSSSA